MCIRPLDRLDQLEQERNFTLKLENLCLTASFFLFAFFLFFPFLVFADWKISWCSGWLSNDPAAEHGHVQEVSGGSLLCAPPSSAGVWGRARQAAPVSRAGCTSGNMWHGT